MTTPSSLSSLGISLAIYVPLVIGDALVDTYTDNVDNYSHTISANGGYTSASFNLSGTINFAEDWLQNGLGRHVVVRGSSMQTVWEGFVNQIDINMGAIKYVRGPLTNLANRVSAVYTEIIESAEGNPITGVTTETTIVEDTDSQLKYGIWEKVINIGTVWPEDAVYIRDLYLLENSYPEGFPSLSLATSSEGISVSISCRGYIDFLENYVYNYDTDTPLSIYASDKIIDVLEAEPNGVISTVYDKIDENLVLVTDQEIENKLAKNIIDGIVSLGGGQDDRWTFGIYANRKAVYTQIPTEVEYLYHKTELTQQIETINGQVVLPWDVVPCKWVAIPEFLTNFNIKVNVSRDDPRIFFGEEVVYTAPDQVTINGSKVRRLAQYMAKLGLGGL